MTARIHALQAEIRTIEQVIDNMSGPMRDYAQDELNNLRFEMDLLNRTEQKNNKEHLVVNQQIAEPAY
jgi:hypothetical protein